MVSRVLEISTKLRERMRKQARDNEISDWLKHEYIIPGTSLCFDWFLAVKLLPLRKLITGHFTRKHSYILYSFD